MLHESRLNPEFARMGDLLRRKFRLPAQLHAAPLRRFPACLGSLLYQGAFQFGEHPDHLPHGTACRCLGVDGFRQGLKLDPLPFQIGLCRKVYELYYILK